MFICMQRAGQLGCRICAAAAGRRCRTQPGAEGRRPLPCPRMLQAGQQVGYGGARVVRRVACQEQAQAEREGCQLWLQFQCGRLGRARMLRVHKPHVKGVPLPLDEHVPVQLQRALVLHAVAEARLRQMQRSQSRPPLLAAPDSVCWLQRLR